MVRTSYNHALVKKASQLVGSSEAVRKWYDEISFTKQPRTSCDYVNELACFCEDVKKTPEQLLELNAKHAYELMKGWAGQKIRLKVYSLKTVHARWYAIRSFFKFHEIEIKDDFPIPHIRTKFSDKIPTREDLRQILNAASFFNTKIGIQLLAYSGIRPEDICDLTYASIKHDFEKEIYPCSVYVAQGKTGDVYVTFMPRQTVETIKQYFKLRTKKGEKIEDNTPLLRCQRGKEVRGIRRRTLSHKIREVLLKSGVEIKVEIGDRIRRMRPYSLRKYFRSNLSSEMQTEFSEALVGHITGLAQIYNGIRDLDPAAIERMRTAYSKAESFLLADGVNIEGLQEMSKKLKNNEEELASIRSELIEYKKEELQRTKRHMIQELQRFKQISKTEEEFLSNFDGYIEGYIEGIRNLAAQEKRPLSEREMAEIALIQTITTETKRAVFRATPMV